MADSPWRDRLRPASFRGAVFYVEVGARSGGRRIAPHEFPKRDTPYPEDMGRKGRSFAVTAYCVGPDYQDQRDDLIFELETEGVGTLVHPTYGEFEVKNGVFNLVERRERGGYCEIEIPFFEAGEDAAFTVSDATQNQVQMSADGAEQAVAAGGDQGLYALRDPNRPLTGGGA